MMIERNWSPITILSSKPEHTVDVTRLTVLCMARSNMRVRLFSIWLVTMQLPKHMAQSMSHTVLSIPAMPRVDTRLLISATPVSMFVDV